MGKECGSRVGEQSWVEAAKKSHFGFRRVGWRKKRDRRVHPKAWVLMSVFSSTRVYMAVAGKTIYVDDGGPADFKSIQADTNFYQPLIPLHFLRIQTFRRQKPACRSAPFLKPRRQRHQKNQSFRLCNFDADLVHT